MGLNPQAKALWSQIRVSDCKLCPLHAEAQTVCLIGDGPVPADIMVIGEAPGFREAELSRPFSGRSGRLLDDTFEKYGLTERRCSSPTPTSVAPQITAHQTRAEMKECRPYLDQEIEAVQPKYILTLGNTALSLVRMSGIMKHRGKALPLGEATVFSTVHPAAVLRNPRYMQLFESVIAAFSRLVRGVEGAKPPRTFLSASIRRSSGSIPTRTDV